MDQVQDAALSKSHDYVNLKRRILQHILFKSLRLKFSPSLTEEDKQIEAILVRHKLEDIIKRSSWKHPRRIFANAKIIVLWKKLLLKLKKIVIMSVITHSAQWKSSSILSTCLSHFVCLNYLLVICLQKKHTIQKKCVSLLSGCFRCVACLAQSCPTMM